MVNPLSTKSGALWAQWQLRRRGAEIDVDGVFGPQSWAALINDLKK